MKKDIFQAISTRKEFLEIKIRNFKHIILWQIKVLAIQTNEYLINLEIKKVVLDGCPLKNHPQLQNIGLTEKLTMQNGIVF